MRFTDCTDRELQQALAGEGLICSIGPFDVHLRGNRKGFAETLSLLYADIPIDLNPNQHFSDFSVKMNSPIGARRYIRPQVYFEAGCETPFEPFPLDHCFPHFEWGLNWLIASQAHQYLMFHSAVLERHGKALILPAEPGSGKSTLCSALMLNGWRLLSDEFGLLRPETGLLEPVPRPIPLKNESIEVIRSYSQDAVLGPIYPNTRKGDVAHLRPTSTELEGESGFVPPGWVVFPKYIAGVDELLHPFAKGRAFLQLSGNSFNYRLQGARGFTAVSDIIENCGTWYLEFSDLDKAVALLTEMSDQGDVGT